MMKWISVKDRLPPLDEDVLVFVSGFSYNSGPYQTICISNLNTYYGNNFLQGVSEKGDGTGPIIR